MTEPSANLSTKPPQTPCYPPLSIGYRTQMPNPVLTTAADAAGRTLTALTAGLSTLRRGAKPLHPEGRLLAGRLTRTGTESTVGVPWLDRAGEDGVIVRVSRAVGVPRYLPDVHGLAIRVRPGSSEQADVLLADTGWDPLTRHLLVPRWSSERPLTTLLPYRSPVGPVVLGARWSDTGYSLWWAPVMRGWRPLGDLVLGEPLDPAQVVSFDPVLNLPPGLEQYPWVVRLRERSYATARSHRAER